MIFGGFGGDIGEKWTQHCIFEKKLCTTKDFCIHGHGWWTIISLQIMCKSTPPTSPVISSPTSSIYVSSISPPSPPPIVNTSIKPYTSKISTGLKVWCS